MKVEYGFHFNETVEKMVADCLRRHSPALEGATNEEVFHKSSQSRILGALSSLTGIPVFVDIREMADRSLLEQCDPNILAEGSFAPLEQSEQQVVVAVANPWNYRADDYCSLKFPDLEIVKILTLTSEVSKVVELIGGGTGPSLKSLEDIDVDDISTEVADFAVTKEHSEPIAQLMATILADAIRQCASDVHIKTEKDSCYYTFRIDGDLQPRKDLPNKLRDRLDAFLLNLMHLAPETRHKFPGISGRLTANYFGRGVGLRYERHRTYRGYHITMRLLDKSHFEARLGMGTLAFDERTLFELERVLSIPSGIIVMSGPTGSGKSTTVNAMLRELNRPEDNILTLENPVEDEIPGVTHCNLKDASEFKPMVTSFMRSDPDIIFMGEVRDRDSAELAIEAAITGHKVLTTIHTPKASQIIERFQQLGIERWKIAQTIKAACAQRLVKLLCPSCKISKMGVSEKDVQLFTLDKEWLRRRVYVRNEEGCMDCHHRGYLGRTAILEILPISPKLGDALAKGSLTPYELEAQVREEFGLPSLKDGGLKLMEDGKTDMSSLKKVLDMTAE